MIFVTPDTQHIAMPWRQDVANLIPHAREFVWRGNRMLLVRNGHDEAKVCRNIGVPVPAPIATRYDWPHLPGKPPWETQKTTAALLTESQRAYVLSTMGCVDADTEYLSPQGWRRIADYRSGEVAEYRPTTGTIAFVEPSQFVKLPCPEMIRFKTTRGVDQLLSPEHRVLFEDRVGRVFVRSAEDIEAAYSTINDRGVLFRTTFTVEGARRLTLTDEQIRLQVAVNADGSMCRGGAKVSVRVKKPRKVKRIQELLAAAGVPYSEGPSGDHRAFRFVPPEPKHDFSAWWGANQHQLEVIADEAPYWDGSHRKADGVGFSSFLKPAADFMQYAFSASGRRASLGFSQRDRRGRTEVEWRVHAGGRNVLAGLVGVNPDGSRKHNVWREPSPDGYKYCFMVPSTFLILRRNGCIFATGNTGKTAASIWAGDYLLRSASIPRRVLVSAPLSTLTPVWEKELFELLPQARVRVLYGDRAKRLRLLADDAEWYIVNHHGLGLLGEDLIARGFGVFIIDELAVFRNKSTELWKSAAALVNAKIPYVWGMTGSPTPQAPTDAWAQIRMLTPDNTTRTLTRFKDQTMRQVTTFKWTPRPDATEIVHRAMQPSVRFTRDDVQELPETVYVDRAVKLEPDAAKAYKLLFDKMAMMTSRGESITAVNEGVLQNKLLQVACGYIYTDKHTVYELPHDNRLKALLEAVEESDRKAIVFVPYVHALKGITEFLHKNKYTVSLVHGGTSRSVRDKVFQRFQNEADPRVLVAHPQCMAHGLTLTAANTIVWYGPTNSLEIYEQANARITRPGQTSKTLIVHLAGTTAEKATYSRLRERAKMQGMLLELFHQQDVEY